MYSLDPQPPSLRRTLWRARAPYETKLNSRKPIATMYERQTHINELVPSRSEPRRREGRSPNAMAAATTTTLPMLLSPPSPLYISSSQPFSIVEFVWEDSFPCKMLTEILSIISMSALFFWFFRVHFTIYCVLFLNILHTTHNFIIEPQ